MKKIVKSFYTLYIALRRIKMFFNRHLYGLRKVSDTFYMGGKSKVSKDFEANDYSYIGPNCIIGPKVKIGRFTMLANNVSIVGSDHIYTDPNTPIIFSGRPQLKSTVIGDDAWIGAFSIIMAGVNIGDGAIIGAGSVVTKDIKPYSINAGIPTSFIKMRFDEIEIQTHKKMLLKKNITINYCHDKRVDL